MIIQGSIRGTGSPVDIEVAGGVVHSVQPGRCNAPDIGSRSSVIAPYLFDMQVNGAVGVDLLDRTTTDDAIVTLGQVLIAHGVSRWMPTLITASFETLQQACQRIARVRRCAEYGAMLPGIHLEGPYISAEDGPRGAHALRHVRRPCLDEFQRLQEAAEGAIRCITLAPEVEGAVPFIRALSNQEIVVALGHHRAGATDIARAVDAGARLCTHLGNGMASQIHRHQNPLWPQLAEDRLLASIIPDGAHLPPPVLKTFVRAKGPERIILTSDITPPAGLPSGPYRLGEVPVEVTSEGRICLPGTDLLAGSALMLLQGVVRAAQFTDLTLEQALASAREIPLALFGIEARWDGPQPGQPPDFMVFRVEQNPEGMNRAILEYNPGP